VFLVAQWVHTHLFYDREYILYQSQNDGDRVKEYRLRLKMTGNDVFFIHLVFKTCFLAIVNDIKSVQKNRGDNDTKYLNKLVVQDVSKDIDVPEEVLKATRKKSPKKCGDEDSLDGQLSGVENSCSGVVVGVEGVDEVGKEVEDELEPHWSTAADTVHSSSTELAPLPPSRRNSNKQPQVKNTTAPQDRPVISRGKSTAGMPPSKLRPPTSPDSVTIQSDSNPPPSTSAV
jgi:hypothetical protein